MKIFYTIITAIFLIIIGILFYNKVFFTDVIVKFDDIEPFKGKMNVYYKGFEIGKTDKIYPDKDFSNTYLKLRISKKNLNLPENVTAELRQHEGSNYISILYPPSPALKRLKNGSIIQGQYQKDIDSFINETINGENIQDIMGNASNLMENANKTVVSLGNVFDEITGILSDIRPSIKAAAKNIEKTTAHLSNTADNLDNALGKAPTKNSVDNIEAVTENLKNITADLNDVSTQINDVSMPVFNSILCETNSTVQNTNEIMSGIKCTLKKHFGTFRLFFGKPVNNTCCK